MTGASVSLDVLAWMLQTLVLACVAAPLPIVFRLRHPRTQLFYCHAILAICILLPLLQPWKTGNAGEGFIATVAAHGPWLFGIFGAGIVLQLLWLSGGLFRIRRYRIGATPLYPIPESARAAAAITHADALFCVSEQATGPVMLGWLAPVVLLPPSFLALDEEAQCGIACHELLHVRRGDWLVTLIEGFAGALLWFNPGVWLLLSEARLAREQLVDAESVRLTESRESYIDALLSIAREHAWPDLAGAPSFLHRSHLTQRMQLLLSDTPISAARLVSSFASIAAILLGTAWLACSSFPLLMAQTDPALTTQLPPAAPIYVLPERTAPVVSPSPDTHTGASSPISSPIPDPYEPVTGNVRDGAIRNPPSGVLFFFESAQLASLRHERNSSSYRFRAVFASSAGESGEISETWLTGQQWRWAIRQGAVSYTRQTFQGRLLEDQHVAILPARAMMLRNEVFWAVRRFVPGSRLRTAPAALQGRAGTCLLASEPESGAGSFDQVSWLDPQGRAWEEEEYCFDDASGDLLIHSLAPGIYTQFEYDGNARFHQFRLPSRIRIYLAGSLIVDAGFQIADATGEDDASLTPPPGMTSEPRPLQVGGVLRAHIRSSAVSQSVVVHAEIDGAGNVAFAEVTASANRADAPAALEQVRAMNFSYTGTQRQGYIQVRPY